MNSILHIYELLDWNSSQEMQEKGILLASQVKELSLLLQPCFEKYNKNIWENCAIVVSQKTDDVLIPYLLQLLEWVQDLNWPGAIIIYNRLLTFNNHICLNEAINSSLIRAQTVGDAIWQETLLSIRERII